MRCASVHSHNQCTTSSLASGASEGSLSAAIHRVDPRLIDFGHAAMRVDLGEAKTPLRVRARLQLVEGIHRGQFLGRVLVVGHAVQQTDTLSKLLDARRLAAVGGVGCSAHDTPMACSILGVRARAVGIGFGRLAPSPEREGAVT